MNSLGINHQPNIQKRNLQPNKAAFILAISIVALLLATVFANNASANTIEPWGSHVVCHGNDVAFGKIKEAYGGDNWYPVTVLIPIVNGNQEDIDRINTVLELAHQYKIYPILRIASANVGRSWRKINPERAASVLNQLNQLSFPDKLMVIYGNEVNMNIEWGGSANPTEYKNSFNSFVNILDTSRYTPIKAPINLSLPTEGHGYGGQNFYEGMGGGLNTVGLDSHSYDVYNHNQGVQFPGNASGLCGEMVGTPLDIDGTLNVDRCLHTGLNYQLRPFIASEFGLGPAMEMSLRKSYLENIFSQNLSGYRDLDIITPLLLDDLRGEQYPEIPVFTANNTVTYIDCTILGNCGGVEACGGGLSAPPTAPGAQKSLNDYLTIPLILQPQRYAPGLENKVGELLYNMVVDQGYEVSCASPDLYVTPEAVGKLMDYFSDEKNTRWPHDLLYLSGTGNHKLDMTEANIPMYRGSEASDLTRKTSSYEGYFGVISQEEAFTEYTSEYPEVKAGVINNLLTPAQQCLVKMDNMRAARDLCEKLEDPELCALHEPIADTNYYLYSTPLQESQGEQSLLNQIESWMNSDAAIGCEELSGNHKSSYPMSYSDFEQVKEALKQTPIDLDKVYRYAFVIVSPQQNPDETCDGKEDYFWYLNNHQFPGSAILCPPGNYINRPKRVPLFIAIKIPTIATNEIRSLSLKNSASLTADTLTTPDVQKEGKRNKDFFFNANNKDSSLPDQRESFLDNIMNIKNTIWDNGTEEEKLGLIINCEGMPQCQGAHDSAVLRLALVHLVNGSNMTCKAPDFSTSNDPMEIVYDRDNPLPHGSVEQARTIGTRALVTQDASRKFFEMYFNVEEDSVGDHRWDWRLELDRSKASAIAGGSGDSVISESVLVHIVAPLGTELSYIESRLASFFTRDQLETMIEENTLVDTENATGGIARYFGFSNIKFGFDDSVGVEHYPHVDCPYNVNPYTMLPDPAYGRSDCTTAGVKLSDNNVGLFIKGAKLGWFIRQLQLSVTQMTSMNDAYNYFASCERIEDLFLGRCGGSRDQYGPPDGLPWAGRDLGPDWRADGKCIPITDESSNADSPCNVNNLKTKLAEYIQRTNSSPISDDELTLRATQASIICNAESGGRPSAMNDSCIKDICGVGETPFTHNCVTRKTVDFSVGLFQINLLAHNCPQCFGYTWEPPNCWLAEGCTLEDVNNCVEPLLDADTNIEKAFRISGAGSNWWAWSTARPKYCGICSDNRQCP